MATAVKRKLSDSTDGTGILVVATATAGTDLHTAVAGQVAGTFDEVWLWAVNTHTEDVDLTIEYGGVTSPKDVIKVSIPFDSGLVLVCPGLILQNGIDVAAFASVASKVSIFGFINAITD